MRKDFADLFAAERQGAKKRLDVLKDRAVDGLELAIDEIPDIASKRKKLHHIKKHIFPLVLRRLEALAPLALAEPSKNAEVLVAIDDISTASQVKVAALKAAIEEEAQRRLVELMNESRAMAPTESAESAVAEEDYVPLLEPGVLDHYVKDAARMHGVVRDVEPMKLISLEVFGAQLAPLPNGIPLGPSAMLIGEAGRGKNYLTDAVIGPLPPQWCLAFESASAASMYYQVEDNPEFLKHRFVYPNEAEATDMLVEFLRPMLSAGKAVRLTVNNVGPNGANEAQELEVQGPITTVIPTVRNKLDTQLQTRLLVAELKNYKGRVKEHSRAFSRLLLPGFVGQDNTETVRAWRAALGSLTSVRRVVFPLDRDEFALDNDELSHGARVWANLLGLMSAHAWLEQRNRQKMTLATGEEAIVAEPADYRVAYELFKETCARTVINLSEVHRKIVDAVYALEEDEPEREGFPQRQVAEKAGVSQSTISANKTFLVQSAKLLVEKDDGLAILGGVEPALWEEGDPMAGIPTPEEVEQWWKDRTTPPEGGGGGTHHADRADNEP